MAASWRHRVAHVNITQALWRRLRALPGFVMRQKRNYRVAVARQSANNFLLHLTQQYSSIYAVGLGADSVQLGTVSSIGGAISALVAMPVGWLVDRRGIKRLYLLAIALLGFDALIYGLARDWRALVPASILASLSMRLSGTGCAVISADSVRNQDRVTAQNVCVTLGSLAAMLAPLLAAYLVTTFGGMNVEGLRPLYYLRAAGYLLVLVFVATQLVEPRGQALKEAPPRVGFWQSFRELFKGQAALPRWIALAAVTGLPMAMVTPFVQLYAHEVKGADQYVLGAMVTAGVLTRLCFGIPLGRLADRIGRKRLIYLTTPLWYLSYVILVVGHAQGLLILAGALQIFAMISSGATSAMMIERVSLERQGRWSGVVGLFRGLLTIPAPIIGGLVWRELGPAYVFLVPILLDLVLRWPLLLSVPETLTTAPDERP
jgi:MFS family permease